MKNIAFNITQNKATDVDSLLRCNDEYFQILTNRPFFEMINSDILQKDEEKRQLFFNYMQIFADHFQTMMQTRQAACRDNKFYPIFLTHFIDELGHDQLLRERKQICHAWDPVLVAVSTWFVHQMQVLDNIDKTVLMHLILEKAGDFYHTMGNKTLSHYLTSDYYAVHAELDEDHVSMAIELLPGYPEFVYERLSLLLKEGWYMMYTMFDRVHKLVME